MIGEPLPTTYCADAARASGAPLYGSATQADVWLLLEHNGDWRAEATRNNDLPPDVQGWLAAQQVAVPKSRVQLIAQDRRQPAGSFFVAVSSAAQQALYRFDWRASADLTRIDVRALLAGDLQGAQTVNTPLVLVCTNGKHDACCARYGTAAYLALRAALGDGVWQTTHMGGHRFAAVGLVLPAGIQYGYLSAANAAEIADALARDVVALPHYRGRTWHTPAVNAADYFARRACDLFGRDALTLTDSAQIGGDKWRIRFQDEHGQRHALVVTQLESQPSLVSCGPPKWKTQPRFRLINHRIWSDEHHAND